MSQATAYGQTGRWGKMPRLTPPSKRVSEPLQANPNRSADFSDIESARVLTAAARAVARELGRQAAREYFAELIGRSMVSE